MAATVRETIQELLQSSIATVDALLAASDEDLAMHSSHACAQGRDVWTLVTNDIDHERMHAAQVLEARYEARIPASPQARLAAEWFAERAHFISTLVGLTDEQFNSPTAADAWTYRQIASHMLRLEHGSWESVAADRAALVH